MEAGESSTWDSDFIDSIIRLQTTLDSHRASVKLQEDMLRLLFEGLDISNTKGSRHYKGRRCIASLLMERQDGWDGKVNGVQVPSNFSQLMKLYRHSGMLAAQEWKICLGKESASHQPHLLPPSTEDGEESIAKCRCNISTTSKLLQRDCEMCCERCPKCGNRRKDTIKFFYISLIEQLKELCRSETFCYEFLALWRARNVWLEEGISRSSKVINEFWDGEKIALYKQFWNPKSTWEAPVVCHNPSCKMAYPAFPESIRSEVLQSSWNNNMNMYSFRCVLCRKMINHERKEIQGDPRNFALMLHWDGFQAATTTIKNSAVVEIVILNGGKRSIIGPLPILFLPLSHSDLEKKHGDVLSLFLCPLINELEILFIDGFEVHYNYPSVDIHPWLGSGLAQLRALLLLCTGDHPAQCKLGQLKDGGSHFCRRDKPKATLASDEQGRRYVYDDNRRQARYPPQRRTVEEMWQAIRSSKRCFTKEAKEEMLRNVGLSGESVLWRLYHLYGFDISKDLVYDVMHILSLNLFQKYIKRMMSNASTFMKRQMDIAVKDVAKCIPKYIINAGRWPHNPSKHHKMFKAEECQKYIQWCLPYILGKVEGIDEQSIKLGLLLIDIAHMFFDCTRRLGWTENDIRVCRTLLTSWRILSEEYDGPNSSPLEHVAGSGEILDDIVRHGSHDCYWCFSFERNVSGYTSIPTNNKANEISYTKFHTRILFTRLWQQLRIESNGIRSCDRDKLLIHSCLVTPEGHNDTSSMVCHDWHERCIVQVSSEQEARRLWDTHNRLSPCTCKNLILKKGVLVGPNKRKVFKLDALEISYLSSFYDNSDGSSLSMNNLAFSYVKIFVNEMKYEVGSHVVLKTSNNRGCIKRIFSHEHMGDILVFAVIDSIATSFETLDQISGMPIIHKDERKNLITLLTPIDHLSHQFFWLPAGSPDLEIAYDLTGKAVRSRLLHPGQPGCVPPWLEQGDRVLACERSSQFNGVVVDVNIQDKKALVLLDAHEQPIWIDWRNIYTILQG